MDTKKYDIFPNEDWPGCRTNAEIKAAIRGYDTLLCLNETGRFSGRSKSGVWCVGITSEYDRITNFINYENNHNRKVIVWSENKALSLQLFNQIKELGIRTHMNLDNTGFLCHSTSIENLHNILKVNALLSYNELIKQGKVVNTVRFELREPEDFLDYIDFCSCESISSEIVVASRQFGKINDGNNFSYKPGVRIYFSPDELQKVQGVCMDGLHTLTIYKELSLDHAKAFVFATKNSLECIREEKNISNKLKEKMFSLDGEDYWTPVEFIAKANELVYRQGI